MIKPSHNTNFSSSGSTKFARATIKIPDRRKYIAGCFSNDLRSSLKFSTSQPIYNNSMEKFALSKKYEGLDYNVW